ncbi:DUF3892 domain-containing protein [Kordiimonas marina]|uniref:DUF3892 domain-containing protein n=1 Tax=Kordiimonas marina TaxID=2872312 RepID=UPI001FF45320|nr:DUF3892 domain-containing protein [Kordiimonas marina]MCJ9428020.1 hypothetical protein [Kordiimonas marina]
MPSTYDVSAVRKDESLNSFEQVTHLYVPSYDGSFWEIPQEEAIEGIRCGRFEFYIGVEGHKRQKLVIARGPYGYYLKTSDDKLEPLSLLSLPEPKEEMLA